MRVNFSSLETFICSPEFKKINKFEKLLLSGTLPQIKKLLDKSPYFLLAYFQFCENKLLSITSNKNSVGILSYILDSVMQSISESPQNRKSVLKKLNPILKNIMYQSLKTDNLEMMFYLNENKWIKKSDFFSTNKKKKLLLEAGVCINFKVITYMLMKYPDQIQVFKNHHQELKTSYLPNYLYRMCQLVETFMLQEKLNIELPMKKTTNECGLIKL